MTEEKPPNAGADSPENSPRKEESGQKKPYTSPTVKEYGSISKLTLTKSGPAFDGTASRRATN